jgi:hypothetical protein
MSVNRKSKNKMHRFSEAFVKFQLLQHGWADPGLLKKHSQERAAIPARLQQQCNGMKDIKWLQIAKPLFSPSL